MTTLQNAISGLFASRSGLNTASNNIANSSTEGYSRQRAEFSQNSSISIGGAIYGKGVTVSRISRAYSDLTNKEIIRNLALTESANTQSLLLSRIDSLIASPDSGLNDAFTGFFEAAQDLSVRPTDVVTRNSFLSRLETLTTRFNDMDRLFDTVINETSSGTRETVAFANKLSEEIAELNKLITSTERQGPGSGANDLLDQRDLAVEKLASLFEVNRVIQEDGAYAIFLKNGQPLVSEGRSYQISTRPNPTNPEQVQIGVNAQINGSLEFVAFTRDGIGDSKLGGLIDTYEKVNGYRNEMGLIAVRFVEEVNAAFEQGFIAGPPPSPGIPVLSFKGASGLDNGFTFATADQFNSDPTSRLQVMSVNSGVQGTADYEVYQQSGQLFVRGKGSFSLGTPVTDLGAGAYSADGLFEFNLAGGSLADGDSFYVSPFRGGAKNIQLDITSPNQLATSKDPLLVGNNEVALDIVSLQSSLTMFGGNAQSGASFIGAFARITNMVGDDTRTAKVNLETQSNLLFQSRAEKDSSVGVNLDEEAANLLKFQQAFQAASQVISVEKSLFEGLINSIG